MSKKSTPQDLLDKLGWEGWPDGMEWFADDEFEDPILSDLIKQGHKLLDELYTLKNSIEDRCLELGAELV